MSLRSSSIHTAHALAIAVLCATAVLVAAWSAQSGWRAVLLRPAGSTLVVQEITPATPRISDADAAPARGVTGTTDLPAAPTAPAIVTDPTAGAAPFTLRGIASVDRARALQCLTAAIYYEAATEGDAGQAAVAQVVLNRVRHPAFPASVCGVVYQGAAHRGCQFSFACDGASTHVPTAAGWARAARAAALALGGRVFTPVGLATHYHTYAVTPAWNRSLVMTAAVGAHFFHRWKGYWGTAAAVTQHYRGAEPIIAPVAPTSQPDAQLPSVTLPRPSKEIAPATPVAVDRLPPASAVLDKWKESGTPLDRPITRTIP
ncbi:cell wall hydrolase [uncultured Sphingomonas sp.]|uniref:cell wall hydrolase n=1 Tax=uncultured Sphingomonas sp. TaxID=158754 RepID=UPI0035CA42C5